MTSLHLSSAIYKHTSLKIRLEFNIVNSCRGVNPTKKNINSLVNRGHVQKFKWNKLYIFFYLHQLNIKLAIFINGHFYFLFPQFYYLGIFKILTNFHNGFQIFWVLYTLKLIIILKSTNAFILAFYDSNNAQGKQCYVNQYREGSHWFLPALTIKHIL